MLFIDGFSGKHLRSHKSLHLSISVDTFHYAFNYTNLITVYLLPLPSLSYISFYLFTCFSQHVFWASICSFFPSVPQDPSPDLGY